jgi:hypothetical protein
MSVSRPARSLTAIMATLLAAATVGDGASALATVAFLGISAKAADAAAAAAAGLPDGVGLTVTFVDPSGPAAAGDGVRAGDVLQKLDDQLLVNLPQMVTLVRLHKPGDAVRLTVVRDGKPVTVTLKLGGRARPATPPAASAVPDDERIPTLPGVVGPDPATGQLPDDAQLPLPGNARTTVAYSDSTYLAKVTTDAAGHRQMVVRTLDGKQVAAGPVDTAEQWAAFPADVRQHLQVVQDLLNGNGKHKVSIHTSGGHAHVPVRTDTTQP